MAVKVAEARRAAMARKRDKLMADQANRERLMGITIVEAPDHARAVEMVEKGEADAFVMDDVLLYGFIAQRKLQGQVQVVRVDVEVERNRVGEQDPVPAALLLGEVDIRPAGLGQSLERVVHCAGPFDEQLGEALEAAADGLAHEIVPVLEVPVRGGR